MWTKQCTEDGKFFYYNSHLNKSLWNAPAEAIIYEAPNLISITQAKEALRLEMEVIEADSSVLNEKNIPAEILPVFNTSTNDQSLPSQEANPIPGGSDSISPTFER